MLNDVHPSVNVRIIAYDTDTGLETERVEVHNVLTNIGRTWLRDLSGALAYPATAAIEGVNARTSERVRFMGFGVGGKLTSDATQFYGTQDELVTVTAIEDYVNIDVTNHLKEVYPQTAGSGYLPDDYTITFAVDIPETEISYVGNTSKSGVVVGTNVPVTEAGLYISGATKTQNPDHADNIIRQVAYALFSPIYVNTNTSLRVEWDFRY